MTSLSLDFTDNSFKPLAAKMRPKSLDDYIGQAHILAAGKPLQKAIKQGYLHSMILWGPPGTGKTTLAEIIAHHANAEVEKLSTTVAGVKDIRDAVDRAKNNLMRGIRTILFVDEVHRFNKSQQDVFLPFLEDGTIIFIGATTENPSFSLNSALLSRARIYLLKSLTNDDIIKIIDQALHDNENGYGQKNLTIADDAKLMLANFVNGDARRALNTLEMLVDIADDEKILTKSHLTQILGEHSARFDNKGDRFYELISAIHKSIRGSSPDAALYWYARMLTAGCDPLYVARRLLAIASEDVGNADPRGMQVALAAWDCFVKVGAYEGERAIAQAIVYLSLAPKSNAVYNAFNRAKADAKSLPDYDVPLHLRNAPTDLMKDLGYKESYRYAHDEANAYAAGEVYLPKELAHLSYYQPTDRGAEKSYKDKLNWLKALDASSANKRYGNKK